jgi:hypothetical protein
VSSAGPGTQRVFGAELRSGDCRAHPPDDSL